MQNRGICFPGYIHASGVRFALLISSTEFLPQNDSFHLLYARRGVKIRLPKGKKGNKRRKGDDSYAGT